MDMVEKIELEDAINNFVKVHNRVLEVALIVGNACIFSEPQRKVRWVLDGFRIEKKDEKCYVTLGVDWCERPITEKYGDPEDDDISECERWRYIDDRLVCIFDFPSHYLYTSEDSWKKQLDECAKKYKVNILKDRVKSLKSSRNDHVERSKEIDLEIIELQNQIMEISNHE